MAHVRLDTAKITDKASFHAECGRVLGFPDFYGQNWDAWNDCMSYLRDAKAQMVGVQLGPEEVLHLELPDARALGERAPDVVRALVECAAFVNRTRYVDRGEPPAIALIFA
jgi:RNAse (barnase) inhibitor barstar